MVETMFSVVKLITPSLSAFVFANTALNIFFFVVLCSLIQEEITVFASSSALGTAK